jgi:Outer membrane protein beta-barrel domain
MNTTFLSAKPVGVVCLLVLALGLFCSAPVRAQVSAGVQVGGQLATMRQSNVAASTPLGGFAASTKPGVHLGVYANLPLSKTVSFRPQILYSGKGYENETTGKVSLNYLHIPAEFLFNSDVGAGTLFFGVGGYFSNALNGRSDGQRLRIGSTVNADFREIDYGARASVGYKVEEGFGLTIFYEHGLANTNPTSAYTLQNRVFGLSLQYDLIP